MFPNRYFPNRYFAPRFWPKVGLTVSVSVLTDVLLRVSVEVGSVHGLVEVASVHGLVEVGSVYVKVEVAA